jgi:hypothetical protein
MSLVSSYMLLNMCCTSPFFLLVSKWISHLINYTDKRCKSKGLRKRCVIKPLHRFCKYGFDRNSNYWYRQFIAIVLSRNVTLLPVCAWLMCYKKIMFIPQFSSLKKNHCRHIVVQDQVL